MNFFSQMGLVMLGGALGSGARFATYKLFEHWQFHTAAATLTVNIVGSFLITMVAEMYGASHLHANTRLFVNMGIMGGLTTYSSFNHVVVELIEHKHYSTAALNIVLTVLLCLAAGFGGLYCGRLLGK